ncbi:prolyl oligopeptidase family serine peptidase [Fulvivirgaceae bacterium PWU4]|uniref:Prolyl oligopeptidase family serine peptidase n=1 Tax=Chryseosolibacter histidini TaxID=2782349 RepID=A0AAP2GQ04_9BACT|nr:prolyl oligopeptidase family serine peptidase [Chryseosolibacter histidini]MBT1699653.1 prolyl oligopeptidase family serine peptidase [Chryseosolibacter histidini]
MRRFLPCFLALIAAFPAIGQQTLTVEKIMRDPLWMGSLPTKPAWSADSRTLYFLWNPVNAAADSIYKVTPQNPSPVKVDKSERAKLPSGELQFNHAHTKVVFEKYGDIFVHDLASKKITQVTKTLASEFTPCFSADDQKIFYISDQNLYSWETGTGMITQLTDFRKGKKVASTVLSEQEQWLKRDQLRTLQVLKERDAKQTAASKIRKSEAPARPKEIYLDEKNVDMIRISPDEKFITFRLTRSVRGRGTVVPAYVTPTGFTEDINARTKVGSASGTQELFLYDIAGDTVYQVNAHDLPGITDKILFNPSTEKDPRASKDKKNDARQVIFTQLSWSPDGKYASVVIRASDNKDRWICLLNPATRKLTSLHRLHDDAWVNFNAGRAFGEPVSAWLNNTQIWFLSEETGYQHLYTADVSNGNIKALTSGKYEVQDVIIPASKKYFYIVTNEVHPGEKQFYRLPVTGGKAERLTTMTGAHEVELSPDEKYIAFRYSYSNKPWELFIMENKPGAKPVQVTNSLSAEFKAYAWRDPELITFKARDNADVYARLYKPKNPNGAAVVFVHGAGYLQNAHKWWSSYFREYMFHNLLADKGYTVLDLDYRASAGYGRDWRTGIYQFMGGKDLTDNIDGAKYLIDQHQIDPKRIGIYGGSYGGFITLMAMFTTPDVFAAGAALRPVTDWAHYNHAYTSNILNVPHMDSLAYAKSSPIYYADGLKGSLLMCHGMVDVNVHFQDVVRLSQRLIELGKDDWELAVYPMEDHAFVEPSSWTDEYKRILKLFETKLK